MNILPRLLAILALMSVATACSQPASVFLIFSKTAGFRHNSIPDGVAALQKIGTEEKWTTEHTEDATVFTPDNLRRFTVVIFLNTTGDVLNDSQMAALRGYLEAGGGFVGIHSATDTEAEDPWYPTMIGARFASHPAIQEASMNVAQGTGHPSIAHLTARWTRRDEWYDFREPLSSGFTVLLDLDGTTYQGSRTQGRHPIAWYREAQGYRVFYTGLGHTTESYTEPGFLTHLREALRWTARR